MRLTNEGRDRRAMPSYELFIGLSIRPHLYILCLFRNKHRTLLHQFGIEPTIKFKQFRVTITLLMRFSFVLNQFYMRE